MISQQFTINEWWDIIEEHGVCAEGWTEQAS